MQGPGVHRPGEGRPPASSWKIRLGIGLIVASAFAFMMSQVPASGIEELTFSAFLDRLERGEVASLVIDGQNVNGALTDGGKFSTVAPEDYAASLVGVLRERGIPFSAEDQGPSWADTLFSALPLLILVVVWIFFMRQMQGGGNNALTFGKSKARLQFSSQNRVTFKDVAGVDEAKEELQEIIEFLREPQKFQKLGGRIPKGVLLVGPPGTGKTLLARAIAGEANVPFFSISGSDFVEIFVGVGASRVRDLFERGKKNAPCLIFIDEIDAVGRHRGAGFGGGHDEREQTLNQLLVELDGFNFNEGVILIAATNRPDVLDPALLRPGRFDRRVVVDRPDVRGREGILMVHTRNIPLADDVNLRVVSRGTPGFCGADLANLVNEAALVAARYSRSKVTMADFEYAKDKVLMGVERRSLIISDKEKRVVAYHEAGHALVAHLLPTADPLHKVTIIPRGQALGATQQLQLDDRHNYTRSDLEAQVCVLLGGRAAEELVLREKTTGAGNDLDRVAELARKMVAEWGMSDRIGPLTFSKPDGEVFLGRDLVQHKEYSENTAALIDEEIKAIVDRSYGVVRELLQNNVDALHRIAGALLEREALDGDEIAAIVAESSAS